MELVCDQSDLTFQEIEQILQKSLKTTAKFGENVRAECIAKHKGHLSSMVRLNCDWTCDNSNSAVALPPSVVLKLPNLSAMSRDEKKNGKNMTNTSGEVKGKPKPIVGNILRRGHKCEVAFYDICMNGKVDDICAPKCFFARDFGSNDEAGLFIFEDLSRIASVKPLYDGLSVAALKDLLCKLARYHAYSIENPAVLSNSALRSSFTSLQSPTDTSLLDTIRARMILLKEAYPEYFDPLMNRLISMLDGFDIAFVDHVHEQLGMDAVLVHGDLWMNNIMWKIGDDGEITDEVHAFVDWQVVHPGAVGEDLVRLFCSSVSPEIRRSHLTELIDHYHNSLRDHLGRIPPFSPELIRQSYMRLFKFGVVLITSAFLVFANESFGHLGDENIENRKSLLLNRVVCLIQDLYALEDDRN